MEYLACLADQQSCVELVIEDDSWRGSIIGTIPPAIGNLTALKKLVIAANGVNGTVPDTIGLLKELTHLALTSAVARGNAGQLSGTLPESLSALTRLENLLVYQTRISGTISPSMGGMTSLQIISMFSNALSGKIPESIYWLTTLKELDWHNNQLSGALSDDIGELTALTRLCLHDNQLTGTPLTDKIGKLTALTLLCLFNNKISGTISDNIGELTSLTNLQLHDNQFSGTLSDNIGKLTTLVYLHFGTNRLSGTIPDAVGALAKLKVLDLSQNLFTAVGGGICAIQAHLTISCDISGNEISGASNYPHIQMNCPVCLNSKSANCNGNLPGNQPLFPSRKCNGDCRCWASDPTSSPTTNPTESPSAAPTHEEPESSAMVRWENIEALLCFGVAPEKAPGCSEVMIAWWFAIVAAVVYEFVVLPVHACRESQEHNIPYCQALVHTFKHQCFCFRKCCCRGSGPPPGHTERRSSRVRVESVSSLQMLLLPALRDALLAHNEEPEEPPPLRKPSDSDTSAPTPE